jgi:S1-C subfamily serine protease
VTRFDSQSMTQMGETFMSELWGTTEVWLVRTLVGGTLLLLLTWALVCRGRHPAQQQRLGEWGMAVALLLAVLSLTPAWLVVSVPWLAARASDDPIEAAQTPPPIPAEPEASAAGVSLFRDGEQLDPMPLTDGSSWLSSLGEELPALIEPQPAALLGTPSVPPAASRVEAPAAGDFLRRYGPGLLRGIILAYAAGGLLLLGRWLVGYGLLARLLRQTEPAPAWVLQLLDELTQGRPPRLVVSRRLRAPLSCGLFRPTIVLPAVLCRSANATTLRWVLAHEVTHLERRDAWSALLFALGQSVYYFVPWFWWLRRQVRLCQEYVADAAAVAQQSEPADYAQFLLTLTRAPALPAGTAGVAGHTSDLYRRVTMLLQSRPSDVRAAPRCCIAAAAGCLLLFAVVVSGLGLRAEAAPSPVEAPPADDSPSLQVGTAEAAPRGEPGAEAQDREEPKPGDPARKPEQRGPNFPFPDIEEFLKKLPASFPPEQVEQLKRQLQQQQEAMKRAQEQWQKAQEMRQWQAFPGLGQTADQRLGVRLVRPNDVVAAQLNLPKGQGQVVELVRPESPASKIGLKAHDIVLQIDGKPVPSEGREFTKFLESIKPNTPVDVLIKRGGKDETLRGLSLPEPAPAVVPVFRPFGRQDDPRLGARLDRPTDTLADQLNLPPGQGLVIESIQPGSAAARAGLKANDVLLEMNGKPVSSDVRELAKLLDSIKAGDPVDAVVLRKGQKETIKGLTLPEARPGRRPALQPRNAPLALLGARPGGLNTTINRKGDQVTAQQRDGSLTITVLGTVAANRCHVDEIRIEVDGVTTAYAELADVPEEYRARVQLLIEASGKGSIGIRGLVLPG